MKYMFSNIKSKSIMILIGLLFFMFCSFAQLVKMHEYDFAPDDSDSTIANRLCQIENCIPLVFNATTNKVTRYFLEKKRRYIRLMLARKEIYFPIFEKYLAEYNLPDELKYLSVVESGLNPTVKSWAGATGLWQFMPSTGKSMGLYYDAFYDDKKDIHKSTVAACMFLSSLYKIHNDWELALAAYNCGSGNVRKAQRKSGKTTFWDIYNYLPKETRGYVPNFIAITYMMKYSDELNLFPDTTYFRPEIAQIEVNKYFNLKQFSKSLNLCEKELNELNTSLLKSLVPDYKKSFTINYPASKKELVESDSMILLLANKVRTSESEKREFNNSNVSKNTSKIYHKIRSGESLSTIANRYHVSISNLKKWNRLSNNKIIAGRNLIIHKKHYTKVVKATPSTSKKTILCTKLHIVKYGESVWSIANKYNGMTTQKLRSINGMTSNKIHPGQKLKLCVDN